MSLRRAGILALALGILAAGCAKEVKKHAPPAQLVLATFDPGVPGQRAATIPLPSDLALKAAPSMPIGVTREVLFSFISGNGWPGDQVITVPIRLETYDAATDRYVVSTTPPAAIDPATINAQTVAIVRLDVSGATPIAPELAAYSPDPANTTQGVIRIRPKGGLPAGRYVVALRGGTNGVKTADGLPIEADKPISIIAPNKDLTQHVNWPPGMTSDLAAQLDALRLTFANPLDWNTVPSEAACKAALQMTDPIPEGECWLPTGATATAAFTAVSSVFPHTEIASIQTFEVASPAVVADSNAGILPFPSDFLLDPATGKVRNIPSLGPAAPGLATLDGFSTTGLQLIPLSAPVKASTITPANVFLYDLSTGLPVKVVAVGAGASPGYLLQPPTMVVSGASTAIGLQPAVPIPTGNEASPILPLPPLKPKTRYLVVVTDGVTDLNDRPLVRGTLGTLLLTVETPLVSDGASNLPGVSVADATALQTLRTTLRALLGTPAVTADVGSKHVVMAYTVKTQDVKTVSAGLTAMPYGPAAAVFASSNVATFDTSTVGIPAAAFPTVFPHVSKFLSANVSSLDILQSATGAIDPTLGSWGAEQFAANKHELPVLVAVPKDVTGARPLVVFHHGLNGSRFQMLGVADALAAKGFIVVATDAPFHGDRAFCEVDGDCNGGTCTLNAADQKAPGTCTSGSLAFDAARLSTVASGNYFLSSNFFRMRDAVREDLLDQSALVAAAARPTPGEALATALAGEGVGVDPRFVYWAGVSLGGIIGTSAVATNPRISRAVLDVAGGTFVDLGPNAPAFQSMFFGLIGQLIPGFSVAAITPGDPAYDPAIAQRYAQLLIVAKWINDPSEAINYAADVTSKDAALPSLTTALVSLGIGYTEAGVFGQAIQGDPVVPNDFNRLLYGDAGIPYTVYTSSTLPADQRHGVIYAPTAAGALVRSDMAGFLEAATVPAPVQPLP